MSRTLRYLRFAFSVIGGIACVLFVVLWVRSYTHKGELQSRLPWHGHWAEIESRYGRVAIMHLHLAQRHAKFFAKKPIWIDAMPPSSRTGFAVFRFPNLTQVTVPYWSLMLLAIAMATFPWANWSRRFRLRTLLIATALAAVLLGLIVTFAR